jgi:threonine dehydratase
MSTTEPTPPLPVSLDDVLEARKLLDGIVRYTPMESSRPLSERIGGPAYLKCENLQRAGAFKIRGAYTRMSRLSAAEKAAGVVAASAGNHAQGVALAAQMLGIKAKVYMPMGAPIPKLMATRGYGAEVELHGQTLDESLVAANQYAAETGAVLIHPFDHVDIVAGQGTVGLEILEQCPDVKTVVVGTGGGGLLAGIATVMAARRPDVRIIGVQAERAAAYPPSLAAGRPVALDRMATMADGIAVGCPGEITYEIVSELVHEFVTVSEEMLSRAMLLLLERAKLVVEPAGAASTAAIMDRPELIEPPAVAVLSGGNIDPLLMLRVLRHGMAAAGRYLQFWVRVPDRPGSLSALLAMLADADANVLEVEHVRTNATLGLDEVEIAVQVETKGHDHCEQVIAALRERGYPLQLG